MIEQSVERVFSGNVDKTLLLRVEAGEFPAELWNLVCDSGFTVAVASEQSGGIGERWGASYPILRGLGYWQVPVPLAETMVAACLLSAAGMALPEGPVALIESERCGCRVVHIAWPGRAIAPPRSFRSRVTDWYWSI
ncbi:MAG: hypothetical protein NTV17_02095 [Burkholderiales bacterium]|nr:hypothetical protein [Burkholderiales bacterium]